MYQRASDRIALTASSSRSQSASRKIPLRSAKIGGRAGAHAERRRQPVRGDEQSQADRRIVDSRDRGDRATK